MQLLLPTIALSLGAYLLGSIPTSVWIGKWFFATDIRKHGSGNAGTTNTFRVLGTIPGVVVFIVDILKGWGAVKLIFLSQQYLPNTSQYVNFQLILGGLAILGHIFPIYANFKGGKGVATLLGVVLAIHPLAALVSAGVFTISLLLSKYVSLSSMLGGIMFPISIIFIFKESIISLIVFSIVVSLLLILTHKKNILRLIAHEENKLVLKSKKSIDI